MTATSKVALAWVGAMTAIFGSGSVQAQTDGGSADEADSGGLSEIVVYAQKKGAGEELQKVPLAVTAVDASVLEASHSVDLRDVGRIVPNSQLDGVGTFPGFANFFMRGVGVSTSVRSLDPAINVVQDGMVIGYQAGAVLDTFDLEGVEVLRGPQGVLFGRNASGGVVSLRSKRPTGDFGGKFEATYGNGETIEFRGAVEGAIAADKVYGRLSVIKRYSDGLIKNTNDGTFVTIPTNVNPTGVRTTHREGGIPKTDELVIKPTLVFDISEGTKLTLLGQYQNYDDGGGATRVYLPQGVPLRALQTAWGFTPAPGKYRTNMTTEGYTDIEAYHLVAELEQDIGAGKLTAIGAYRHLTYDSTLNVGGDPFDTIVFPDNKEKSKQFSFEARYNVSLGDSLDLMLGGYYLDLTMDVEEYRKIRVTTSTLISNRINIWDQDVQSHAFFGNLDWKITPELTLSGGLRYSKDTKQMHIIPLSVCTGQNFTGCNTTYLNAKRSWDDVSPRAVLTYQIDPDVMVYGSYSRGYRAGNFNARAVTAGSAVTPANPETVSSFEAGFKSQFLNDTLRFNILGFHMKYDDIQRIVQVPIPGESPAQNLFNAAKATIKGVEMEVSMAPTRGLRFDANFGYTDAKYDSFNNLTGLPAGVLATDLRFDRVPKITVYVAGNYEFDLPGDAGEMSLHAGYAFRSHVFTDVLNTRALEQKAYGLFDASLKYTTGMWSVSLFGRNIGNVEYADIKSANTGYNAFGGQPRTYGVQLGVSF